MEHGGLDRNQFCPVYYPWWSHTLDVYTFIASCLCLALQRRCGSMLRLVCMSSEPDFTLRRQQDNNGTCATWRDANVVWSARRALFIRHSTLFPYKLVSMLGNVCCIVSNRIWISCSRESHTIMRNSFLIKAGGSEMNRARLLRFLVQCNDRTIMVVRGLFFFPRLL